MSQSQRARWLRWCIQHEQAKRRYHKELEASVLAEQLDQHPDHSFNRYRELTKRGQ